MEKLTVTALTKRGEESLNKHIREMKRMKGLKKVMLDRLYRTEVKEKPLRLIMYVKSKELGEALNPQAVKKPINQAMKGRENLDYKIKVI